MIAVIRGVNERTTLPLRVDPNDRRLTIDRLPEDKLEDVVVPVDLADDLRARSRPVGSLGAYVMYAHTYHLYEAHETTIARILALRGIRISPIYLPRYNVWQRGPAQLLWTTLHTISALSHARDNAYVECSLVTMEYVDHYIWCGECKYHWLRSGGSNYYGYLRSLPRATKRLIDVDVALARCHDFVTATIRGDRELTDERLVNILTDYREFARVGLLRAGPRRGERRENEVTAEISSIATLRDLRREIPSYSGRPNAIHALGV